MAVLTQFAASVFCTVGGGIYLAQEFIRRTVPPIHAEEQAQAHGDPESAGIGLNRPSGNDLANFLGAPECGVRPAVIQHDEEFFTAVAPHKVVGTYSKKQAPRHFAQDLVSHKMTVGIVDAFEVVEIAEQ